MPPLCLFAFSYHHLCRAARSLFFLFYYHTFILHCLHACRCVYTFCTGSTSLLFYFCTYIAFTTYLLLHTLVYFALPLPTYYLPLVLPTYIPTTTATIYSILHTYYYYAATAYTILLPATYILYTFTHILPRTHTPSYYIPAYILVYSPPIYIYYYYTRLCIHTFYTPPFLHHLRTHIPFTQFSLRTPYTLPAHRTHVHGWFFIYVCLFATHTHVPFLFYRCLPTRRYLHVFDIHVSCLATFLCLYTLPCWFPTFYHTRFVWAVVVLLPHHTTHTHRVLHHGSPLHMPSCLHTCLYTTGFAFTPFAHGWHTHLFTVAVAYLHTLPRGSYAYLVYHYTHHRCCSHTYTRAPPHAGSSLRTLNTLYAYTRSTALPTFSLPPPAGSHLALRHTAPAYTTTAVPACLACPRFILQRLYVACIAFGYTLYTPSPAQLSLPTVPACLPHHLFTCVTALYVRWTFT